MNVQEMAEALSLTVLHAPEECAEISGGYVSDLLSNVMGQAQSGDVWITMQGHQNIIAVASLVGLSSIIVAGNTVIEEETLRKAQLQDIWLLSSELPSFVLAGRLYELGIGRQP